MRSFIVPWKREGVTNVTYSFKQGGSGGNKYVAQEVTYTKKAKQITVTAYVLYKQYKPEQYTRGASLVGETFREPPSLK